MCRFNNLVESKVLCVVYTREVKLINQMQKENIKLDNYLASNSRYCVWLWECLWNGRVNLLSSMLRDNCFHSVSNLSQSVAEQAVTGRIRTQHYMPGGFEFGTEHPFSVFSNHIKLMYRHPESRIMLCILIRRQLFYWTTCAHIQTI